MKTEIIEDPRTILVTFHSFEELAYTYLMVAQANPALLLSRLKKIPSLSQMELKLVKALEGKTGNPDYRAISSIFDVLYELVEKCLEREKDQ